jgi:hypothetical protein
MAVQSIPGAGFFHTLLRDLPERLPEGTETLEERIYDPLFRVDGDKHHRGTNIVSFLKREGSWRISGLADNGRSGPRPTN